MNAQEIIKREAERQQNEISLIPSENYVSYNVRNAVGSVLMNKYSEGRVGKRYYKGNRIIDELESYAIELVYKLFKLDKEKWDVIIQPATGSIANLAVISGLTAMGDTILSQHLFHGGHLSHGWQHKDNKTTLTSKLTSPLYYGVLQDTELIDYDALEKLANNSKPRLIFSGGTAYPRAVDHKTISKIAHANKSLYIADIAHEAGLVAAGEYPGPFEFADVVTMTTRKTLRGPIGAIIIAKKEYSEQVNSALFPGIQGGPLNHSIAGIAVALEEALEPSFKIYIKQVLENAQILAKTLVSNGFKLVTSGTDKHLLLVNLNDKPYSGTEASDILESVGIITNKNTIPFDKGTPSKPSGLRLGTPAITTRGFNAQATRVLAELVCETLNHISEKVFHAKIAKQVLELATRHQIDS